MIQSFRRLQYAGSALLVASLAFTLPSRAQDAPPTRVAVASPSRVLRSMQEVIDLRTTEKAELVKLGDQETTKKKELEDMAERRNKFTKPGTEDYQKQTNDILQKQLEDRNWAEFQQAQLTRDNKQHMQDLFDKIKNTIGKIAEERKIDLVLSDQGTDLTPDELDKLTADQVNQILHGHNVLYSSKTLDITDDVIARLNAAYKGSTPPAAPSTPTPAPSGK
jgi:Skp family chaperone for outer membrane proteins